MIRRTALGAGLAVLGAGLMLAPLAVADKPGNDPLPAPDATGAYCEDFDVLLHATNNKERILTFSDGRALVVGKLKMELTNLETGKTIAVNASGPVFFAADGSTVTLKGATLLAGQEGFFGPGSEPRLTLGGGSVVVDLASGAILSERGHSIDLCARLA